jgi:choline dehydrogenase-like flavoprotein
MTTRPPAKTTAIDRVSFFGRALTDASVMGSKRLASRWWRRSSAADRAEDAFVQAFFPDEDLVDVDPGLKSSRDRSQLYRRELRQEAERLLLDRGLPVSLYSLLWWLFDQRAILTTGQRYSRLDAKRRARLLASWSSLPLTGTLLRLLSLPLKAAYLKEAHQVGDNANSPCENVAGKPSSPKWKSRVHCAAEQDDGELEIEADVVIVGSGAGGAVAAYELSRRGHAVVIVEQGDYVDRSQFNGNIPAMVKKLYRSPARTTSVGNTLIPIPVGKSVGGTTTVNSGTCIRTPEAILKSWRADGLTQLQSETMHELWDEIERQISVDPAERQHAGPICGVIEKGAAAMGLKDTHLINRNALACDGQGLCQFGCPSDAKQSTNVSYIPKALSQGANIFTGFRADRISFESTTATGITARGKNAAGQPVSLSVKAPHVIIATGSLATPDFLARNGIRNRWLGKNLSLHPTGFVAASFPGKPFANQSTIPQGFAIADLKAEGILFEGATPPLLIYSLAAQVLGGDFVRMMDRYANTAFFGFLIKDESRGKIRRGMSRGNPLITYNMNRADFRRYLKATEILARLFFKAGAEEVYLPALAKMPVLRSEKDVDIFSRTTWHPRDFSMTAYHPLGTARIAATQKQGVCDADHQVFGHEGLYVMDGSSVPSSLGVNPQLTIMALALRAARTLATKLEVQ